MSGRTFESIAEALGCSKGTAYNRVQMAIESQKPHADFDAYRSVQMAELKMSRTPLRATVVGWQVGDDLAPVVSAIATLLKLQERESKLLGLDRVPTPFDEISTWSDEYLEEMVGEMAQEFELDS